MGWRAHQAVGGWPGSPLRLWPPQASSSSGRAAQAVGPGLCPHADLVILNVLATPRDVLKNVSLSPVSSIWVSLYSSPNTPMPVLHAGPVPTFSSQNQPSRRQTPTASPLSPSPPHLQAKPQEGPVAAISKGPVADVVPPRRVQTPATLSLGRVERSRSYRTWRKAGKGHLAGRMGRQ